MKKTYKKFNILATLIVFVSGILFFCIWQNNNIVITESTYYNSKIPSDFNEFTIAHISDFHNKLLGKEQVTILNKIKSISPDIIVITGDLIDRRKYDLETAMTFIKGAMQIAPIYYVSGNHEAWSGKFDVIKDELIGAGVHILDNTEVKLSKGNSTISILGVADPDFHTSDYMEGTDVSEITKQLSGWSANENFKILLSHRPELFDLYCDNNMDLIFTGHAHGGQFRIPGIGGLVAPDQGLFPKYTSGSYSKEASTMFVSRGIGNSVMPIRIFNRPEIVAVTLRTK
ncbi:MAG: metallophosphoesterase [Cellulosilyticaceae bacterium]